MLLTLPCVAYPGSETPQSAVREPLLSAAELEEPLELLQRDSLLSSARGAAARVVLRRVGSLLAGTGMPVALTFGRIFVLLTSVPNIALASFDADKIAFATCELLAPRQGQADIPTGDDKPGV